MFIKPSFRSCFALCLGLVLSANLSAGQAKKDKTGDQPLKSSIKIDTERLERGRPAFVEITLENVSGSEINLEAVYSFALLKIADESIARNFSVLGDSYWSPFDLLRGTPLKLRISDPEMLKKGVVVGRVPKGKLHLATSEVKTYKVELTKLLWSASILSGWPNDDLFDEIPKGRYWLVLRIRGAQEIRSNQVEVTIG